MKLEYIHTRKYRRHSSEPYQHRIYSNLTGKQIGTVVYSEEISAWVFSACEVCSIGSMRDVNRFIDTL